MLSFVDLRTGDELVGDYSSVLCLGNFDGVHIGHAELIRRTIAQRKKLSESFSGILGGAWCFLQPPADFLYGDKTPQITSTDEKLALLSELGLDFAVLGEFSELRNMSPHSFVEVVLKKKCRCVSTVCGFNYSFGKGGEGGPDLLKKMFSDDNAIVIPEVTLCGETVSSTGIRKLLASGDVEAAMAMMGRPYCLTSRVEHGKMLGRALGFPTINQQYPKGKILLKNGVYCGMAEFDGTKRYAVINVGVKPTVSIGQAESIEANIIDFSGDLYGKEVKISFFKRLRPECKFDSVEELAKAVHLDIAETRKYFKI